MSINQHVMEMEDAARSAVLQVKAVEPCPIHRHVLIRIGDHNAERHAYARATTMLKRDGTMFKREDLMAAIKNELDMAADGECPECAQLKDA